MESLRKAFSLVTGVVVVVMNLFPATHFAVPFIRLSSGMEIDDTQKGVVLMICPTRFSFGNLEEERPSQDRCNGLI